MVGVIQWGVAGLSALALDSPFLVGTASLLCHKDDGGASIDLVIELHVGSHRQMKHFMLT